MSPAATIFAITFVLFVGITLAVPSFPPSQSLNGYLGVPQTTLSFWAISVATVLNGITNGLFWTVIAITAYSLTQRTQSPAQEVLGVELDIETIKGIGPVRGALFRNSGIDTVNDLLREGATEGGRHRIADDVGVPSATVLTWVYRGDSLRVKNIKRKHWNKRYTTARHATGQK